jgi:hypothetical protein
LLCADIQYICSVKAVANGALAWHINIPYEKDNKEFQRRKPFRDIAGDERVSDAWSGIVEKVGI